jgi:hypothetical protein
MRAHPFESPSAASHSARGDGPLFQAIVADQFERVRDGDRYWYQRSLSAGDLRMVQSTTLADVIRRNSTTTNLQDDVFYFHNTIKGRLFIDIDRDGRRDRNELGLAGITVQLRDPAGNVIASAITSRNGTYSFEGLDLGVYQVRAVLPANLQLTTRGAARADLTRAEAVSGIEFGVSTIGRSTVPPAGPPVAADALHAALSALEADSLLDPLLN